MSAVEAAREFLANNKELVAEKDETKDPASPTAGSAEGEGR